MADLLPLSKLPGAMSRRRFLPTLLGAALSGSTAIEALGAAVYPTKPVRLIVPASAGSQPDVLARVAAEPVAKLLGQPLIVENIVGAGGNIGVETAARAEPDGHTILFATVGPLYLNRHLSERLNYDIERDFEPVTQFGRTANLLVVHPSLPVRSVADLVAHARAKPGAPLRYGSGGYGTSQHICAELLRLRGGFDATHVPYGNGQQMLSDLLGERIEFIFANAAPVLELVRAGKLRALAVTTNERFFAAKDLPTMVEAGYPDIVFDGGSGILVPRGTPAAVIDVLTEAFVSALRSAPVRQRLAAHGTEAVGAMPAEFRQRVRAESARWAPLIRQIPSARQGGA